MAITSNRKSSQRNTQKNPLGAVFCHQIVPLAGLVYRVGLRITRNTEDAKDVQQETFLKAYLNSRQFEGRSLVSTWVTKIAQNEALMCLRKRRRVLQTSLEELIEQTDTASTVRGGFRTSSEGPEAAYLRKELRVSVGSAISSLAPAYRVVFILRAIEELSTKETAGILHLSTDTVKTRLRRARLKICACFRNAGIDRKRLDPAN